MVKFLKVSWKVTLRALLMLMVAVLALFIWLHEGERSLAFAKPWITNAINSADAPYTISIGNVSVNWSNPELFGSMRITNVAFAKRDGNIFAQFPEIYATIDPIGFLPSRHLLHRVMLRQPRLFMTRNIDGLVELGIEDSPSRMPLSDLITFLTADASANAQLLPVLPFSNLIIEDAHFTFTDALTETNITSTPFHFSLKRHHGAYDALLAMPFMVDAQPVMLSAGLRDLPTTNEHLLAVQLKQFPARLVCLFNTCPEGVAADGAVDGTVAIAISDEDLSMHGFRAALATKKATLTLPKAFAEPLKLGASSLAAEGDWSKRQFALTNTQLQLEDTRITASGKAHQAEDGWYITGAGETTQLDITKVYKYWPLFMAPDSRKWITSKLKSGYAEKGTLRINFTPEDLAAEYFPEKSIDAVADARDITFEYLPGFPLVKKMNGIAHFTATTVKVEGSGGSLLDGTTINHAVLWCPELNSLHNPMEATVNLTAPASDAATMLALKHFPFDDKFGLDPATIHGTVDASMKLKFNAFSGKENSDPNEIHLEAVDYDITTNLKELAQKNIYGGYDVRNMNGVLKASNGGLAFEGMLQAGESEINDIKLTQDDGKPLSVVVKGRPAAKDPQPVNDFSLTYASDGEVPIITVRGKRLDASVSYGGKENSLLANFPAMKLDVNVGELVLVSASPLRDVMATLYCTVARCESGEFSANIGASSSLKGSISRVAGARQFLMTSADAGSMLKAFDVTDRMTKGKFEMRGTYDDSKPQPQLNARLIITDFTLINSKILGRILSIGSLTGLANALTGSGISFDKLAANLTSHAGVITVDKGMASGNAIGITVGGTVDTTTTKLALKGVVVPAYALNSFLGKIPVIGLLAGGEGEGLIAFNYSISGTYEEPDVGVNPLSGLTPGFLRGIFGVFDGKQPEKSDDKATTGAKLPGNGRRP